MEKEAVIKVRNLNAGFDDTTVVSDINFDIKKNKIIAIIGPSGCGKTTMLRCFNRIHELTKTAFWNGSIKLLGQDITTVNPMIVRKKIGMVFQKPNPFPKSIYNNIAYGIRINGIKDKKKISAIIENSLKDSGIWDEVKDRLDKQATDLSGGQQQRICIARTIATSPDVVLMDEPCSALDPISTFRIEELMNKLKKEFSIIIVTHNMQQAARVSDYTAFMYLGKLIEFGETNQIFTNPKNDLTEKYISGRFG